MAAEIHTLHILIDCALLWAFWYFAWKPLAVQVLRCSLYRIRNRLFDMAASEFEGLSLCGRQYQVIRQHLTVRLWHSHELSSVHLYITPLVLWICGIRVSELKPDFLEFIESIRNEALRKRIQSMIQDADIHTGIYFLMASPFLFIASVVSVIVLAFRLLISHKWGTSTQPHPDVMQIFKEENLVPKAEIVALQADMMEEDESCIPEAVTV